MPRNAYYSGFKHINFVEATINPSIIYTLIIFEFFFPKVIKIFKLILPLIIYTSIFKEKWNATGAFAFFNTA